ncbi:hypothetical protein [Andreprevotia chitinilytica]|uniref:hypothetical protein n=1 Tax=Andreprevotia chitinilytica TaxID=396808 RepID=UPI00054E471F|nr:hypothetical protein [Andreprevotia chitinilytica]
MRDRDQFIELVLATGLRAPQLQVQLDAVEFAALQSALDANSPEPAALPVAVAELPRFAGLGVTLEPLMQQRYLATGENALPPAARAALCQIMGWDAHVVAAQVEQTLVDGEGEQHGSFTENQ